MTFRQFIEVRSTLRPTSACLGVALALVGGCGAESDGDTDALALAAPCDVMDAGLDQVSGDGGTPDVDGGVRRDGGASPAYVVSIAANGTGCRAGTWSASIAPDGQDFVVTFSDYFAAVTPQMSSNVAVKDCQLAVKLRSPQGLSYSISDLSYPGYAFLEEGVTARQVVGYYFQGNPVASEQIRTELSGPMDDTYVFEDRIRLSDAIWSPCGVERDLNIRTQVRVQNSNPKRTGYINVERIRMPKLRWRKCDVGSGR